MTRSRGRRSKLRSLFVWHRWIGLPVALFALIVATTGIALNHTERLRLDERRLAAPALLAWYGISSPVPGPVWRTGDAWVSVWGERLYIADSVAAEIDAVPAGAIAYRDMILVAEPQRVLLFSADGALLDVLGAAAGTPADIEALGLDPAGLPLLRTAAGVYRSDEDLLGWSPSGGGPAPEWSETAELPEPLGRTIAAQLGGLGLPLERVLLDLHSGRLLGAWGNLLFDLLALLLLFNAFSGLWLWLRRTRNRR